MSIGSFKLYPKIIVKTQTQPSAQFNWSLRLDYILLLLLLTAPASQVGRLYNSTVTANQAGRQAVQVFYVASLDFVFYLTT